MMKILFKSKVNLYLWLCFIFIQNVSYFNFCLHFCNLQVLKIGRRCLKKDVSKGSGTPNVLVVLSQSIKHEPAFHIMSLVSVSVYQQNTCTPIIFKCFFSK